MNEVQVVSISFFRYEGIRNRWWAFAQMGKAAKTFSNIPGLQFCKMLGSGGGNGFSIRPNFGLYGLLAVWTQETFAQAFFTNNLALYALNSRACDHWTVFMRTVQVHGKWDGETPFDITSSLDKEALMAVLTRATIKTHKLWQFWRYVPSVSRSMDEQHEGSIFAVGIGELPLVQQATFSLWKNTSAMTAYAYQSKHHREVVRKTRELGWYKEELFARFHPYASLGSWYGKDPLAGFLSKKQPPEFV